MKQPDKDTITLKNCKILLIDTSADINLLNELLANLPISISVQSLTSVSEALRAAEMDAPDLIMIGSSIVIKEGLEFLLPKAIPIIVLCESSGLDRFLKVSTDNICFITRPLDIDRIPEMIMKAIEFISSERKW